MHGGQDSCSDLSCQSHGRVCFSTATSILALNSLSFFYEIGHVAHICSRRESRVRVSVESTLKHWKCSVVDDIQSSLMGFREHADADHE